MIVTTKRGKYKVGKHTSLILPQEIGEKIEQYFAPPSYYEKAIKKELSREITEAEIKASLCKVACLVLEGDTRCNISCIYCVYSGNYQFYRHHGNKQMSLQTAQKAVDFYYNQVLSPYQIERKPKMLISFYGGESLLELDTVINSVKYAKSHRDAHRVHLKFSLSTNGVLLTPEVVKRLVEEKISVAISLDGPESEHDRFRVFRNGKGTFKKIMKNVEYIKREYPDYFEKSVGFIVTIHPFHDLKKIEAFFLSQEDLFHPGNVKINDLKDDSLNNIEWMEARADLFKRKKTELQKDQWFYKKIFTEAIELVLKDRETMLLSRMNNFTRACFPGGEKLFVDPDGNLHICEKINRYFSIGNLADGFNIQKIKSILEQWRKKNLELECWKCLNLYFCSFCYASTGVDGTFVIKKEDCRKMENSLNEMIYYYLTIKEEDDEKIISNHDHDLPGFLDSL